MTQDCLAFLQPQLLRRLLSFITDYQEAREGLRNGLPTPLIGFSFASLMFLASIIQTVILHQVCHPTPCLTTRLVDQRANSISKGFSKLALEFVLDLLPSYIKKLCDCQTTDKPVLPEKWSPSCLSMLPGSRSSVSMVSCSSLVHSKSPWRLYHYTTCWGGRRLLELQLWFVGPQPSRRSLIDRSQVISVPLNTLIASVLKKLQLKQMKSRDKRTNMMSELLNNIKRFALSLLLTVLGFTAF